MVGAYHGNPDGKDDAGQSYVVFGHGDGFAASLDLGTLDGVNGFRIDGIDQGDLAGISVSGAGDVNGDGIGDLIVGAAGADPETDGAAGESYVIYGHRGSFTASFDLESLDGLNGFRLDGINTSDLSGYSVAGAGDINGDGFDDLVVGARLADPGGDNAAGETYVVFGGNFPGLVSHPGSDEDDELIGSDDPDIMIGGLGNDVLLGGAGDDRLDGATGDDRLIGGTGDDMLIGDPGDDLFVFRQGDGDDSIADFVTGAGSDDVIDLTDFGFADLADVLNRATDSGADTVIALDIEDSVTLLGVDLAALDADDFLL